MWNSIKEYSRRNPARVHSYILAVGVYLAKTIPNFPQDLFNLFLMGSLGVGESIQRYEDKKTLKALYIENDPEVPDTQLINEIYKK
jgi:hypothetical protein